VTRANARSGASRTGAGGRNGNRKVSSSAQPRRRKREEEVVEAAAKVFYERGYASATVQDVADELGILKGSLYHYIDTKEDLLFGMFEEIHTAVDLILEEVIAAEGLDPLERLELYVRRQVTYNLDNLQRISIYYHDMEQLSGDRLTYVLGRRKAHNSFVTDLITEAQEQGLTDPALDAKVLSNCVFGTIIWTYRWYRPRGGMTRAAVAEQCSAFALRGIIGEPRSTVGK
jgi:AcrR family transcriptional regulator